MTPVPSDPAIVHHAALDARLVAAVRGIRLLSLASWPASTQAPFLDSVARGAPRLPQVDYPRHDFSAARRELEAIAAAADPAHPLGRYVRDSAASWDLAARLLEALGTQEVDALSAQLIASDAHADFQQVDILREGWLLSFTATGVQRMRYVPPVAG